MRHSRLAAVIAASAIAAGAAGATATMASAATVSHHGNVITTTTRMVSRYDSGGNGNWAYDGTRTGPMVRTMTLDYLGKVTPAQVLADPALAATPYMYDAQLADHATLVTIPGAFTPNQGGRDAGLTLRPIQETGTMTGFGDFGLFYSSVRANSPHTYLNSGVPSNLRGPAQNSLYPSATWPELAFPAGATFSGVNESWWGYFYTVPGTSHIVTIHGVRHVIRTKAQTWQDTVYDGAGQLRADGNIR
jgi:hypothetical protein